jgi:hypothetical protein
MKIENNLLEISKCIFQNKNNWKFVTSEQKEQFFFIFNRMFSKKYPYHSQLLNDKSINKSVGMDLWFEFFKSQPYPQWFWSKSAKTNKSDSNEKFELEIKKIFDLKEQEFEFLVNNFPEQMQSEIDNIKLQNDGNNTKKLVHSKSTKQS